MNRKVFGSAFVAVMVALGVAAVVVTPGIDSRSLPVSSATDLYIGPGGTDTGTCTNSAAPCATPGYAMKQLSRTIAAGVIVHASALPDSGVADYFVPESVPGSSWLEPECVICFTGFRADPSNSIASAVDIHPYLHFEGQLVEVLGTQTATSGSGSSAIASTVTVSGATYTVNAYKGMFIEFLSNATNLLTFSGEQLRANPKPNIGLVVSNTATQITFIQPPINAQIQGNVVPSAGTTFHILKPGTRFWSSKQSDQTHTYVSSIVEAYTSGDFGSVVVSNFALRYVDIMSAGFDTGITFSGGTFNVELSRVIGDANGGLVAPNAANGISTVNGFSLNGVYLNSPAQPAVFNGSNQGGDIAMNEVFVDVATAGDAMALRGAVQITNSQINNSSGSGISIKRTPGAVGSNISGTDLEVASGYGLDVENNAWARVTTLTGSAGTGYGIKALDGAHVEITAGTAITGSAGDTTVDGSAATTYVTIRGNSPTSVQSTTHLSRIWQ